MLLDKQCHHTEVACHGEDTYGSVRLFSDIDVAVGDVIHQSEGLLGKHRVSNHIRSHVTCTLTRKRSTYARHDDPRREEEKGILVTAAEM